MGEQCSSVASVRKTAWRALAAFCLVLAAACSSSHPGSKSESGASGDGGDGASGRSGSSANEPGAGRSGAGGDRAGTGGDRAGAGGDDAGGSAAGAPGSGEGGSDDLPDPGPPKPRPEAPPWEPHFEVGDPGWRESSEPLCTERFGSMRARGVWTDGDSVFALVATTCNALANVTCGGEGLSLYENDGAGWEVLYETKSTNEAGGVSGFAGGDIVVYGSFAGCTGITHVARNGDARCAFVDEEFRGVQALTIAGTTGYAVNGDRLLAYEAPEWREVATLPSDAVSSLWAGSDDMVAAGYQQLALRGKDGSQLSAMSGAPAGDYTAVWSFGTDLWFANTAGQLVHYDGQDWKVVDTKTNEALQLWGSSDGVLYFIGDKSFGRWKAGAIELFAQRPAEANSIRFSGIWGNAADEVFLSVIDRSLSDYMCSGAFMVFFDGSQLHVF